MATSGYAERAPAVQTPALFGRVMALVALTVGTATLCVWVARGWGDFRSDALLPGVGAGLRFTLDKKNHINYRVDYAFGRDGRTLSIGVGEAF